MINGRDCRIMVPGGSTIQGDGIGGTSDLGGATARRFGREEAYFSTNPMLGKVPVIATVWMRSYDKPADSKNPDDWHRAPAGVRIVFELIPPFDGDDGSKDLAVLDSLNLTPKARRYVGDQMKLDFDPKDPQRMNCSMDRGGKRGRAVPGDLFALSDTDPDLNGPGSRWPWRSEQGPDQNSVVVTTDANGFAGVCFKPSRMSGDVYRIRAYVEASGDPGPAPAPGADDDGGGFSLEGKPATSGKLTVWRSVRISRFLRKTVPSPVDPNLHEWVDNAGVGKTLDTPDLTKDPVDLLKKAFIAVDVADAAKSPSNLGSGLDADANTFAVKMISAQRTAFKIPNFDYTKLLTRAANKPYVLQVADTDTYNASVAGTGFDRIDYSTAGLSGGAGDQTWTQVCEAYLSSYLVYFTGDADPGITLIEALAGDEPTYSDAVPAFYLSVSLPKQAGASNIAWNQPSSLSAFSNTFAAGQQIHMKGTDAGGTDFTVHSPRLNGHESIQDFIMWVSGNYPPTKKGTVFFIADPHDSTQNLFVIPFQVTPHHGDEAADSSDSIDKPNVFIATTPFANPPAPEANWNWWDQSWTGISVRKIMEATTSGEAHRFRGAFLFYGKEVYDQPGFCYTIGKNVMHELSHVLYCAHQMTPNSTTDDQHDYADFCILSYDRSPLGKDAINHCGRCLLNLRGWDINKIPPNPGQKSQRREHGMGVE
jgi:hypothetical protein